MDPPQDPRSTTTLPGTFSTESDFVFKDGTFYATFDGYVHARKSAPELYEHLSYVPPPPAVNENGKRIWSAVVDSYLNYPAHFYSAQLIHYGFKPLKTKSAAKKKLLEAFGGKDGRTLEVPRSILELESRMKRNQSNSVTTDMVDASDTRKSEGESLTTENDHVSGHAEYKRVVSSTKRARTKHISHETNTISPDEISVGAQSSEGKRVTTSRHKILYVESSSPEDEPNLNTLTVTPTVADLFGIPEGNRDIPVKGSDPKSSTFTRRTKRGGLKATAGSFRGSRPRRTTEPRAAIKKFNKLQPDEPTYDIETYAVRDSISDLTHKRARQLLEILFDRLPAVQSILQKEMVSSEIPNLMAKEKHAELSEWPGLYEMEIPSLDGSYDESRSHKKLYTFEIYPSSTSRHIWAYFNFGRFRGVMRSLHSVPKFFNTEIFFEWRGYMADNSMFFDEDNRAIISLHPGGLLQGHMFAAEHGTYRIYGCRPQKSIKTLPRQQQLAKIQSWKLMWRRINAPNREASDRAKARLATYSIAEEKKEDPFLSDTTDGEGERTWSIDLENFMSEAYSSEESTDDN
ncbi:hypothetical protein JR316_0004361 [Psilocybe cubensis]|uniref:Uncharacterized protein n=2 Tax=Psilocybe cubensis TaxID=181762 RepID=A0A8H8CKX7_PSICU|nr:hypothetical protein JR316_0004361 [Psilocybe cubensis]KAH9482263.1 hypothetical protein JR316_0004361 [Psilocybe cubensis]